jgi:hypothetical protein
MMSRNTITQYLVAGFYVALILLINPILLDHEHASSPDSHHSDRDVCAWLDHAAGAGVAADAVPPVIVAVIASVALCAQAVFPGQVLFSDPVRGPPLST